MPSSVTHMVQPHDWVFSGRTRTLTTVNDQVASSVITPVGLIPGDPGLGVYQERFTQSGPWITMEEYNTDHANLALMYKLLPAEGMWGRNQIDRCLILAGDDGNRYLGAADAGDTSTVLSGNANSGRWWINGTDYANLAAVGGRDDLMAAGGFNVDISDDWQFLCVEAPEITVGTGPLFPFVYSSNLWIPKLAWGGYAWFGDWDQRLDVVNKLQDFNTGLTAYRFWRLRIRDTDGGSTPPWIGRMELRDSGGTDLCDSTHAQTNTYARTCGEYNANCYPDYAFTSGSSAWFGEYAANLSESIGDWLIYDFGEGQNPAVATLAITNGPSGYLGIPANWAPKDFVLEKSVNCRDWEIVVQRTNETGWAYSETRTYALS